MRIILIILLTASFVNRAMIDYNSERMELKTIDTATFDAFVFQNTRTHFMQTSAWGEVAKARKQTVYHLGLYDGDTLKATALLLEKKLLKYRYFYCPRGFICDYEDHEVLKAMVYEMTKFCKKHHGLYFKIDPDLIIRKLDKQAQPIATFEDKLALIDEFSKLKGRHKGFTIRFADSSNPRFTFRLKLDKSLDEIVASFHPTLKNIIKRNNPYGLKIYRGDQSDVKKFYQTMVETSKRKEIVLEPFAFFDDFYTILNKHGMSDIYVAKLDVKHLKNVYQTKQAALEKELAIASAPDATIKQKKRLNDIKDQLNKIAKEAKLVAGIQEDELVLSSVITAKYKDKVWIVHGGNSDELKFVNANYEVYYQVIKDALAEGYTYVDFFGAEGEINPDSSLYGITLFKMRFGGDYDEFIGEFDFILKPVSNKLIMSLIKARRKYYIKKAERKNENR